MSRLSIDQFTKFFHYYQGLPHQQLAVAELWKRMPVALLENDADWVEMYRSPEEEEPKVDIIPGKEVDNSWGGVYAAAKLAGAKFPECVAAQWALESGWGQHTSGVNNFFGLKGEGTDCVTWEHFDGKDVTITDSFKNFDSVQDCVNELVKLWYKDYKNYKGVNRASTAEECAELLRKEGYATDPNYSVKLIGIMQDQM